MTESSSSLQPESGLMRSNLTVATGTAMSRVTGLIRIVVFGIVIGQTALADAFDVACPNAVYELLIRVCSQRAWCHFSSGTKMKIMKHRIHHQRHARGSRRVHGLAMLAAPLIFHLFSLDPARASTSNSFVAPEPAHTHASCKSLRNRAGLGRAQCSPTFFAALVSGNGQLRPSILLLVRLPTTTASARGMC